MENERIFTVEEMQERVINNFIAQLLRKPGQAENDTDYDDNSLQILEESAPKYGAENPVLFEMMRIINGVPILAGPFRSQAAFYTFGDSKTAQPYFIYTTDLRQLLLDHRFATIKKRCDFGQSIMAVIPKQLLFDHCVG